MGESTVVVVGGGVIGLSTAYHLARLGQKSCRVILLEKDVAGAGSSGRAAGITTGLLWSETGIRCRRLGIEWFRRLSEELEGYRYHDEHGCLTLFTAATWPERERLLALYDRVGAPYEVLAGTEVRQRWPSLTPPADFIGLHDPNGGYSEPDDYIAAMLRSLRISGVDIREHVAVESLIIKGGNVRGVRTREGEIRADAVVSGVHAWTLALWSSIGLRVPVKNFVHQRYVSRPLPTPFVTPPVNADPYFGYLRPAKGNRVLIGAETTERNQFDVAGTTFAMNQLHTPPSVRDDAATRLAALAPAISNATWESEDVGLICFSMDGEPLLGPAAHLPGFYLAGAFHSGGFSYNTVAGLLLAEMALGRSTSVDVTAFSPDRFSGGAPDVESYLASSVPQRAAVRRRH